VDIVIPDVIPVDSPSVGCRPRAWAQRLLGIIDDRESDAKTIVSIVQIIHLDIEKVEWKL
jgi:hypothetical protein